MDKSKALAKINALAADKYVGCIEDREVLEMILLLSQDHDERASLLAHWAIYWRGSQWVDYNETVIRKV